MIGRMLGRICSSPHDRAGHRCGECEMGWPRGRRAQKRRETREWRREVTRSGEASPTVGAN